MSRQLPEKPNLEYLKKEAKELLHDYEARAPEALERFHSISLSGTARLSDAQHLVAREYGFATWAKLKEHVEAANARLLQPEELLAAAVRVSDSEKLSRVLADHPQLKTQLNEPMAGYGFGMQPILAAVQRSDRKSIDVLLRSGADINVRSQWWAGGFGVLDDCDPDMAGFLIERGAVVDAHAAARLGMMERLQSLVAADPSVARARGGDGQTPLHFASTIEIAEFLLAQGAEIDARDIDHESTAAQYMLRVNQARHYRHDRQPIARFLISRGCWTDIFMAAALGDLDLARRHLEADPECIRKRVSEAYFPKQNPKSGWTIYVYLFGWHRTPHQVARDFGHDALFQILMDHSPEDLKLQQACMLGDEHLFRKLLAKQPDLVATLTDDDRRRVTDAAQNNNTSAVRLMLSAGWPVDTPGEYDLTPLQWASWHGNAEMVREILRYGPSLESRDNHHKIAALGSALHGSVNGWHRDTGDYVATVDALLAAGARAPEVTDDLEASEAVRDLLRQRATTQSPPR